MSDLRIIPPSRVVRGVDPFGSGAFGASRARWTAGTELNAKVQYTHKGLDFVVAPGAYIPCPCDAWIIRTGIAYSDEVNNPRLSEDQVLGSIRLEWAEDPAWQLKYLYARPIYKGGFPFRVDGGIPFAVVQSVARRYPGIVNHCHVEIRHRGVLVDPATILMEQA